MSNNANTLSDIKKNINLYFGEDDFTIAEEIKKEKEDFEKRSGSINVHEVNWNDQNLSKDEKMGKLQDGLMSGSLFSSDKLLIIKNSLFSLSRKKKEDEDKEESNESVDEKDELIFKYLKNPQEEIKIFFIEEGLDKRKKIYKELVKLERSGLAEIKEFDVPADFRFENWIKNRIEKSGGNIEKDALNIFAISLGKGLAQKNRSGKMNQAYNLWEASNEIGKLINYCNERKIKKEDIELLVKSKVDMNIFNLIDNISSKNKAKAILLLNKQLEEGLNENYILTMFVYQFRNLIKIKSLLDQGLASQQIVSQTKMHPFVVQKSVEQCQKFDTQTLKKIYKKLFDADLAIKTGKMDARLVLDLIVVSV
ncbi:MAG: DNA polymerase III subunit delta [Candidatus Pacebacteria bacterium]|nr:DNA polymerase III subunit delta [Candidatus Paceibacterota bacterium]